MIRLLFLLLLLAAPAWAGLARPDAFAQLAVQDRGRKKPFTSFARESTLQLTGRSSVEAGGKTWSDLDLVVALWLDPTGWDKKPILAVESARLKKVLGLPRLQSRFSYRELAENPALLRMQREAARRRIAAPEAPPQPLEREAGRVAERLTLFARLAEGTSYAIVPDPSAATGTWGVIERIATVYPAPQALPPLLAFQKLAQAWTKGDAPGVNEGARELAARLRALSPGVYPPAWRLSFENTYLQVHPWRWAWLAYLAAACVCLLGGIRPAAYRWTWALALAGFAFQAYGFASRIVIAGRPPVTNMFESIVWVAFAAVLFALVLEAVYRPRLFLLAALPLAAVVLLWVDMAPLVFDSSIQPLVPVLRNNFWLSIHVLTITMSYGAFALAMGLGHIALGRYLRGTPFQADGGAVRAIYRAVQIGVLLLAAGTILGGVWANYSWGRFWDWDPKETWALITLLGYLALLHGRFAGWWGGFGLAVGSLVCFLSVVMAWYGVNFVLGKGLHSYGFGFGGTPYVAAFAALEVALVSAALWKRLRPAR
ncbi:MAG: cytochrome c biogenesis protein CcsA [Verrucomicrobium sp.]|nr:cytochrome c biogenesis protein CcsA [Verrucomicrobium sp.]